MIARRWPPSARAPRRSSAARAAGALASSRALAHLLLAAVAAAACLLGAPRFVAASEPALPHPAAQASRGHLVVIVGAAGDEIYREVFHRWALQLIDSATANLGLARENIVYLGERPEIDPERIDAKSSREDIEQTLARLAAAAAPDDRLIVVLIGHGSGAGEQSRFNIPGPDLTALQYDALLDRFVSQRVAFVNTSSASGDFVGVLSGPNRVVVTATRDARQSNQTVFPRFFVEAFAADVADLDKDGRVSLFEAYAYARREVARFYDDEGRMLTETAQLDDNGDGEGSHEPAPGEADGAVARALFLDDPAAAVTAAGGGANDPGLRALYDEQRRLREQIEQLKLLKASMSAELYMAELEGLLVALARTDEQIREKGGR